MVTMGSELEGTQIVHIPGKLPVQPDQQTTVDVLASVIEPKYANSIVRRLNQVAPLENLRHVKRVRKKCEDGSLEAWAPRIYYVHFSINVEARLQDRTSTMENVLSNPRSHGRAELSVLLCLAPEYGITNNLPNYLEELVHSYSLSIFTVKVCKYAALTKEEWEEQCKLWPTSFHPPTYNIDGIIGFSDDDSRSVVRLMSYAVELAKAHDGLLVNAAVIVDPKSCQVIATSCDEVFHLSRPADKDKVESEWKDRDYFLQNGSLNRIKLLDPSIACFHPWNWVENLRNMNYNLQHPLRHAALVAIQLSAERDRQLFPGTVQNEYKAIIEECHVQCPATLSPAKRQKIEPVQVESDEKPDNHSEECLAGRPYLCTGYDIYLVWEPCAMCAMALVHQRVRRIFFAFPNPSAGALGSVQRLQGEKSLNHHYAVFRVLLPEDVLQVE